MSYVLRVLDEHLSSEHFQTLYDWREHAWGRGKMNKLAYQTVHGKPLHHLHPGEITVYRGAGQVHHSKSSTSWSKSLHVARKYAQGRAIHSLQLTKHHPAIDVNKALENHASKSTKDHEVFLAKGDYKIKRWVDVSQAARENQSMRAWE